ncbi:hypothetical protein [Burkholderia pyrrocinia]|uniref:hypothetical protein n=1 Tax=Burkholderia pyrrocinia TaxID=60550 RepID=UPI002AB1C10E|nr:hypothetical protein [Burkholderia pyrrocinia]
MVEIDLSKYQENYVNAITPTEDKDVIGLGTVRNMDVVGGGHDCHDSVHCGVRFDIFERA